MEKFADADIGFLPEQGQIQGSTKDKQSMSSDWKPAQDLINGVKVKEIKNVLKENGFLTEIFRTDWALDEGEVQQVFQVILSPGGISAWHAHQFTTDRIFVSYGWAKMILFDAREDSPTYNLINEFRIGINRPTLLVVPPGVWHGSQNISTEPSCLINLVDRAYTYDDPDHWRLPIDTPKIPYSFMKPA